VETGGKRKNITRTNFGDNLLMVRILLAKL